MPPIDAMTVVLGLAAALLILPKVLGVRW